MRSANWNQTKILGLIASGALLAGCGNDAQESRGTIQASLTTSSVSSPVSSESTVASTIPEPRLEPVDPATAKTAWKEGVALFDRGDYVAASESLKTAVAGSPDDPYRRYLLGLALWKSGDLENADASLVESTKLDATRVKTWINLSRVRHARGDRSGALETADKALEIDPTSADALHQKGRALMELQRGDEALEALTTARDLDADNGYIANTLGLLLIQLGKPGDAVEPLEVAKSALPNVAYVRNNLGVAYERTGRLDDAKLEYLAAVEAGDAGGKAMKSLVRLGATDTTQPMGDTVASATNEPSE